VDDRDAGDFERWITGFRKACAGGAAVDVPCQACVACCESGQVIPVAADETDALAHISSEALAPMPGEPGAYVLRHDEAGRCSQLVAGRCSIYAHRPRACRTYDCRVFAAAGVQPDKPRIAAAAQRWRFTYTSAQSRKHHDDVRTAAVLLGFPGGLTAPVSPTQRALAAVFAADELESDSDPSGQAS
jgi:Fe-S-cluster containining protein